MNIFVLDTNLTKCTKYYFDKHVTKMLLEGTQILCTVCHKFGIAAPYQTTHPNHPCVLWAGRSIQNWRWLKRLVIALNKEYKYRYVKKTNHKSFEIAIRLAEPKLPKLGLTEHCQAMPDKFRIPGDPVRAYRNYYMSRKYKKTIAKWTRRKIPQWYE